MKTFLSILFILFFLNKNYSQELILNTNFAVRDFIIVDNSLIYIEKRDIKSYNLTTKAYDNLFKKDSFFIGGYGLKVFYSKYRKKIITASNELIRDISSIRFYDIKKKDINKYHVYFTTGLMDFYINPKDSLFVLSKKNLQLELFKYGGEPRYKKIDSIKLDSYSRKIELQKENLYYITDSGKVCQYNFKTRVIKKLYHSESLLVNFIFDKNHENLYITTFDGKIIQISLVNDNFIKEIVIGNEIIEAIGILDSRYIIIGDWSGNIKVININSFEIEKQFNNKKRIIKIVAKDGCFYTSDSDKTIKKWKLK